MTNGNSELPELPAPRCTYADHSYPAFTKQQMIDYARSALSVCADGGKGEAVIRYDLCGEFMKHSAYGEWIRFDDTAPQAEQLPQEDEGQCDPRADAEKDAVLTNDLRKFLDVAAGQGYQFDGVDADDLYLRLFPNAFDDANKEK